MENTNTPRAVYNTKRRTPSARGKSWAGTLCFFFGAIAFLGILAFGIIRSNEAILIWMLVSVVPIVLGIVFWARSGVEQNGTISFYDDRIVHKCRNEVFEFFPGQISSVVQSGNVVKIVFAGKTLTFVSVQAAIITQNINAFISAYAPGNAGYAAPAAAPVAAPAAAPAPAAPAAPAVDKAEEIRKYKQLVDDGVISQEQFDAIIKKMM